MLKAEETSPPVEILAIMQVSAIPFALFQIQTRTGDGGRGAFHFSGPNMATLAMLNSIIHAAFWTMVQFFFFKKTYFDT
jgi:hypothetical protein